MKAQKSVLLGLSFLLSLCPHLGAESASIFNATATDLSVGGNYTANITPTAASTVDIKLVGPYTNGTTFTINGATLDYGSLNDLDTSDSLIITNTASTAGTIELNQGTNNTVSKGDMLYVASGANLTIESGTGTTTLEAFGGGNIDDAGTLAISGPLKFQYGTTTLTFIGTGSTTLSGGSGTGAIIVDNPGGTLTLSGSAVFSSSITLDAGTLTNNYRIDGATVINGGTYNGSGYIYGTNVTFTVNDASVSLSTANTYTGATTIDDGGTISVTGLHGTIADSALVLGNASTAGGGNLSNGGTSSNTTQTVTGTTLYAGASTVKNSVTGDTIALTALTRNAGSTIDFGTTGTITTSTANANISGGQQTILGGYATYGGTTWAVSGTGATPGTITGLATGSYSTTFTAGTDVDAQTGTSTPGTLTINSLRFNNSGTYTVNQGGTLTVATGGILETTGVGAHTAALNGGTLASGNSTDLIVTQNNTNGGLTIGSQITGTGIGLTKSGAGALTLAGANNYTGVTTVNAGSLLLGTGGTINTTTGVSVAGGATFGTSTSNGSALTLTSNAPTLTLNLGTSTATQSNLQLNLFSSGSSDTIDVSTLTLNAVPSGATGTVLLTLNDTTGDNLSGQYNLLTWTSSSPITITTSDFTLAGSAATEGTLGLNGDDLIFTAAPEPSTWALFIGGLGLLGLYRFRRSQFKPEAEPDSIPFS